MCACFDYHLYRLGDLEEMSAKGSLHEYLAHLHDEGRCPVTSFWWGKEHVVSVCSPQAFKDTVRLTDRAGERERRGVGDSEIFCNQSQFYLHLPPEHTMPLV